jgi:uridine kinase
MTVAGSKPYLIGVAGPSCAGKTELSRALQSHLNASLVSLDSFYFDLSDRTMEERARFNFDQPTALDHDLFFSQLESLASGRFADVPVYDFSTHSRTNRTERIEPRTFIVVEGLFVLYWADIRSVFGTKVFVDLDDATCLERRVQRDVRERGRTAESVIQQFHETVVPMADLYVRTTRQNADIVIPGDSPIDASVEIVTAHIQHVLNAEGVSK